jgi:hypothetical protein
MLTPADSRGRGVQKRKPKEALILARVLRSRWAIHGSLQKIVMLKAYFVGCAALQATIAATSPARLILRIAQCNRSVEKPKPPKNQRPSGSFSS